MAAIPESHLDPLRAAGLLVSEPYVPTHVAFPDGVFVCKPASVAGHSLPNYELYWDDPEDVLIDAPGLWLFSDGQRWLVKCHEYAPGPGSGDFVNVWGSPEEAVADILDFYFGSPTRMDVKRLGEEELMRQIRRSTCPGRA